MMILFEKICRSPQWKTGAESVALPLSVATEIPTSDCTTGLEASVVGEGL